MPTKQVIPRNLRHLRLLPAIADTRSLTGAAQFHGLSQTAVTHALHKLEAAVGSPLFERSSTGAFPTDRGAVLLARVRRALDRLDPALESMAAGLSRVVTQSQLIALIATADNGNVTLAARRLGLSQPTVQRAITDLERAAARPLFDRAASGLVPRRACLTLCRAARLAFAELDQAEADLAEFDGRIGGRIVVGALPLCRSNLLPSVLVAFQKERPGIPISVLDGRYDDLLAGLVSGKIDMILGALRDPAPMAEVEQHPLFEDRLCFVAGPDHPMTRGPSPSIDALAQKTWIVPRQEAPSRHQFESFFQDRGMAPPRNVIESGSVLLMRETLRQSDMLGCVSGGQAAAEIRQGLMVKLVVQPDVPARPIGLTFRSCWFPTTIQGRFLDLVYDCSSKLQARHL